MKVEYSSVLLCFLTLALYFSSSRAYAGGDGPASMSTSAGVAPGQRLSGRRLLEYPSSSSASTTTALGDAKTQDDGRVERSPTMREDREADENAEEGLVYNVDYHGVITHPSPLPRHPQP